MLPINAAIILEVLLSVTASNPGSTQELSLTFHEHLNNLFLLQIAEANKFMTFFSFMKIVSCLFIGLLCLFPSNAYAYIDPGTGSYFFQLLLAGLLAAGFLVKSSWKRIKSFLQKIFSGKHG